MDVDKKVLFGLKFEDNTTRIHSLGNFNPDRRPRTRRRSNLFDLAGMDDRDKRLLFALRASMDCVLTKLHSVGLSNTQAGLRKAKPSGKEIPRFVGVAGAAAY